MRGWSRPLGVEIARHPISEVYSGGMEFVVKRVYEQPDPDDGYRALVDRLWPRGMRKDKAAIDEWAKDLAPSAELRSWYHQDLDARREEFAARYREELSASEAVEDFLRRTEGQERVTLLYAARDTQHNHALVLRDVLQEAAAKG